jgi:hypothetical protein
MFDLRDTWTPDAVPSWWATAPQQNVKPQMNVLGALYAKENCATPTAGCSFVTRLNAGLWKAAGVNNTTYAMLWNPTTTNPRPVNSPYRTSNVLVHYIQDGQGELFTITPMENGGTTEQSNLLVAGLEASRNQSVTGAGQYRMPFTLKVRRR